MFKPIERKKSYSIQQDSQTFNITIEVLTSFEDIQKLAKTKQVGFEITIENIDHLKISITPQQATQSTLKEALFNACRTLTVYPYPLTSRESHEIRSTFESYLRTYHAHLNTDIIQEKKEYHSADYSSGSMSF